MSRVHLSPEDAVCVHRDVRSRQSIGMHWGTFRLTDEDVDEPPRRLRAAMELAGKEVAGREGGEEEIGRFGVMSIGETILVGGCRGSDKKE